jgi:hypothetical protein
MENHMKDILQDLVAHTHALGFIPLVKVSSDGKKTEIEAMAEDRSVIVQATTSAPVGEFEGVFGMPNLNKLDIHLKCPEYKEDAKISVVTAERNGEVIPTGLHFQNAAKDFENNYRFMNTEIINEKLKSVKMRTVAWDIEFEPTIAAIQKLRFQAAAHTEETVFQVKTDGNNLVFSFGDASTHAGEFIFHAGIDSKLKQSWSWPVVQVMSILALTGDKKMHIADVGAMQITVNSGLAEYNYILPAQSK